MNYNRHGQTNLNNTLNIDDVLCVCRVGGGKWKSKIVLVIILDLISYQKKEMIFKQGILQRMYFHFNIEMMMIHVAAICLIIHLLLYIRILFQIFMIIIIIITLNNRTIHEENSDLVVVISLSTTIAVAVYVICIFQYTNSSIQIRCLFNFLISSFTLSLFLSRFFFRLYLLTYLLTCVLCIHIHIFFSLSQHQYNQL